MYVPGLTYRRREFHILNATISILTPQIRHSLLRQLDQNKLFETWVLCIIRLKTWTRNSQNDIVYINLKPK